MQTEQLYLDYCTLVIQPTAPTSKLVGCDKFSSISRCYHSNNDNESDDTLYCAVLKLHRRMYYRSKWKRRGWGGESTTRDISGSYSSDHIPIFPIQIVQRTSPCLPRISARSGDQSVRLSDWTCNRAWRCVPVYPLLTLLPGNSRS